MKGTVFLLEDDKSICELVRCALEMADIDTVCFNTVADFNAALNQHLPAVALLDIMLPDGSGLDVLKKLKQSYPQVACIMLSALGQESDKVKGLNLGADDYISKPFGAYRPRQRSAAQAGCQRRFGMRKHQSGRKIHVGFH